MRGMISIVSMMIISLSSSWVAAGSTTAVVVPMKMSSRGLVGKTGQVTTYETLVGAEAPAGTTDGALQKGNAWPNPRFTDNGNGTVTDNLTSLVWLKNAACVGVGQNWAAALSAVASLADGACSLTDGSAAGEWRMPNILEMTSLIAWEYTTAPMLADTAGTAQWSEGNPFTSVQTSYFTSTTMGHSQYNVYGLNLSTGLTGYAGKASTAYYVWPVRNQ